MNKKKEANDDFGGAFFLLFLNLISVFIQNIATRLRNLQGPCLRSQTLAT